VFDHFLEEMTGKGYSKLF